MLPKLYVDQVRLRPIRLPVGLQVVIPQLIHSKTWTHRGQTHQTRIDPNDLWNWSKLGNCAVRQTAYYTVKMWICIWTPPKRKITQFLRLCPLPKDVYRHLYTQQTVCMGGWGSSYQVYRKRGTTPPGSRSPEPSRSAPAASGQLQVVSCSVSPYFKTKNTSSAHSDGKSDAFFSKG